jgi:hypothetical protein
MNKKVGYAVAVIAILGGAAAFYFLSDRAAPPAPLKEVAITPAETPSGPQYPVANASGATDEISKVPSLDESDPTLREVLIKAMGAEQLEALFNLDNFIRRWVVTIANCEEEQLSVDHFPFKPLAGVFLTRKENGHIFIDPKNEERYTPYLALMNTFPAERIAKIYLRLYPLFQAAYGEISNQDYFNDRLIHSIDYLLDTPDVKDPIEVTPQDKQFKYADDSLEELSASQKMLLRMGSKNSQAFKDMLRKFRADIVQPKK